MGYKSGSPKALISSNQKEKTITPPILVLAWRRPDLLSRAIEAVRAARPRSLYIACDGPNSDRFREWELVSETRGIVDTKIDWPCKLEKLYATHNQGCKVGVSRAISWFFRHENEGIILEDDCVAHPDFFVFCTGLLERYRYNERVSCITGDNFQAGARRGGSSYYFSKYPHCWGWATWRRAWKHFNPELDFWPEWKRTREWRNIAGGRQERRHWEAVFDKVHAGSIDSWALPWMASVWKAGGLTATPTVNLVTNIGFGAEATHTKNSKSPLSIPSTSLLPGKDHPSEIKANTEADRYVFKNVFLAGRKTRSPLARVLENGWRILRAKAGFNRA